MSDNSAIEWTEASWPVTVGCDHVSPGCDHCYAATLASGRLKTTPPYIGLAEHGRFNGTVRTLPERLNWPLRWRKPRRIFVCSMSDLFHEDVPDEFIARVFAVMAEAPRHTFQVLSKRHARMRSLLSSSRFPGMVDAAACDLPDLGVRLLEDNSWELPLPNVWLGVSVEDQKWADIRIPALLDTPAAVRWISAEPLLGPIRLSHLHTHCPEHDFAGGFCTGPCPSRYGLDWVVVGGESGTGARPMDPAWAGAIVQQCQDAGVPVFVKQMGSVWASSLSLLDRKGGHDLAYWPADLRIRQYPGPPAPARRTTTPGRVPAPKLSGGEQ